MKGLVEKIDVLVFGLVLVAAVAIAATGAFTGKERAEPALKAAHEARAALEAGLGADRSGELAPRRALEATRATAGRIERQWLRGARPAELPTGVFHHDEALADALAGRELEVRFFPPRDLAATAEPGSVRLTWAENDQATVPTSGWVVHRRRGEGEMEEIARLDADARSFVDAAVLPGALYVYEVAALSDDDTLVAQGRAESPRSRPAQARAARDFELELLGRTEGGAAEIRIRKMKDGAWRETTVQVEEGQAIGGPGEGGLDFRTGARLVELRQGIEDVEERRSEVVFEADGTVALGADGRPETRERTITRRLDVVTAIYENELGQPEKLFLRR